MRVGALVQARMRSVRLPGKVLMPLAGRPAIVWLLERLERAQSLDGIVVATSTDPSDDAVAEFCERRGTPFHRGDLLDVAGRLLEAARVEEFDAFARVNGDSPLLDQRLVDRGVELMRTGRYDLVSNVRPRSFPPGQSVEVVRTAALERALASGFPAAAREHVTAPLYGGGFTIGRFETDPPRIEVHLTLDTAADARRLEGILNRLERPHWEYSWDEVLAA